MRRKSILALTLLLGAAVAAAGPGKSATKPPRAPAQAPKPAAAKAADPVAGKGKLAIDVTDVLGHDLPARVELQAEGLPKPILIEVPKGHVQAEAPARAYKAYIYVYCLQVPVMVDAQDVTVKPGDTAFVLVNVLEGTAGSRGLLDFDQDCDFAIDRVEVKCGTNPKDAGSIPGRPHIPADERVLSEEKRWYRGELHAHSRHGIGKETVAQLIARAEKAGLDFLAITDRNTMDACVDPEFHSDSLVLIPALEWGSDERGVALIYGAQTFPSFVDKAYQAQALVDSVQAQNGFYAIAHPCFPTAPWQWGLGFVNGVEVWCRGWRDVPPLALEQLSEDLQERLEGKLVHSIAFAATTPGFSANGQAAVFYDAELVRGARIAVIGGSNTASPEVPMAAPVTYVYANQKSIKGILDGMRQGRTYVSSSLKGPQIHFSADVMIDKTVDCSLGGTIPLRVPTRFFVAVENAKGADVQILLNGQPFISKSIEDNSFALQVDQTPENYAEYRVRVAALPKKEGFGPVDVLAVSSPIYAQELAIDNPKLDAFKKQQQKDRKEREKAQEIRLPSDPTPGEIKPNWRF